MKLFRAAAALALVACTQSAEDLPVGERSLPIVGGIIDVGDPAVGALVWFDNQFCTGTLVAPRAVITAAHCIEGAEMLGIPITEVDVFFGTDTSAGGTRIHVLSATKHPMWNATTIENDVAMLKLAIAAPMPPEVMNTQPFDSSWIGHPVRIVGFGVTSASSTESGQKRHGLSQLQTFDFREFVYGGTPSQTCFGDSGGPAFMMNSSGEEVLAGVTSAGDPECVVFGVAMRVDFHLGGFIQPFIDAIGETGCGPDGDCIPGCVPPDPDCVGDPCDMQGDCILDCPIRDPDCFCMEDGNCDLGCSIPDPDCVGDVAIGHPCVDNYDCQTGYCGAAGDDPTFRYCSRPCQADEDCPIGMANREMHCEDTVVPLLDVCSYDAPSPGVTGADCLTAADCRSGRCIPWGADGSSICTEICLAEGGADCPLGYSCGEALVAGELQDVCLPAEPGGQFTFCAVTPGGRSPAPWLFFAAVGLGLALRRRKRD